MTTVPQASAGPRRPGALHPPLLDVLLASFFVLASVAEALTSVTPTRLEHLLVAVPTMAALAWRRRFPLVIAAAVMVSNYVVNPEGELSPLLALVLASYTVGAETSPPRSRLGLGILVVPFLAAMVIQGLEPSDVAAALVFLVGPWTVGSVLRQRSARAAEAVDLAASLEREREAQSEAAAGQERARIARELHDIVSHSISVVAIQTQAVRKRLGADHQREADDLAAVETTARQALAEMRRLFGVLRTEGQSASLAPQPGLGELDRLLLQVRGAGLPVELEIEGEPTSLPPGVDLAAYRIVQEGLTNTLRHAAARQASVRVRYLPGSLDITVQDDGRGVDGEHPGHGLTGIRERVALYSGTVEAGSLPGGGYQLTATLPIREAS